MLVALNAQQLLTTCKDNHRRPFAFIMEEEGLTRPLPSLIQGVTVLGGVVAYVAHVPVSNPSWKLL